MTDLVATVAGALVDGGFTLAVAESCTGGLLATRLTDPAGASRYFSAGLVTYSNASKERLLGVDADTLRAHGAVSGPVAREMARGAIHVTGAGAALAITGVAGPDGGSADKPVGTVWIAAVVGDRDDVRQFAFSGSRSDIREASVRAALRMLGELLLPPGAQG